MTEILSYWDPSAAAPAFGEPSSFYDCFDPLVASSDDQQLLQQQVHLEHDLFAQDAGVKAEDMDLDLDVDNAFSNDLMPSSELKLDAESDLVLDPAITTINPSETESAPPAPGAAAQQVLPPAPLANHTSSQSSPDGEPDSNSFSINSNKIKRTRARKSKTATRPPASKSASTKTAAAKCGNTKSLPTKAAVASKTSLMKDTQVLQEDVKRDKFLERNRIAASKCRQKRKEWMHNLEEQKQEMENAHWQLQNECHMLVAEVSKLKNMIMGHAHCHDKNVDRWIETEAKRIVSNSGGEPILNGSVAIDIESMSSNGSVNDSGSGSNSGFDGERRESRSQSSTDDLWESPPQKALGSEFEINYDHMPDDMFLDEGM